MTPEAETAQALRRLAKTLTKLGHSGQATCERAAGLLEALWRVVEEGDELQEVVELDRMGIRPSGPRQRIMARVENRQMARARLERARAGGL